MMVSSFRTQSCLFVRIDGTAWYGEGSTVGIRVWLYRLYPCILSSLSSNGSSSFSLIASSFHIICHRGKRKGKARFAKRRRDTE